MNTPDRQTVLIVDDDSFVRTMLGGILEENGYLVETAGDGLDALEKYKGGSAVDLIISDMNMPLMNGLEFVRRLRCFDRDVPVIILTVNNEISLALDTIRSGASDYLLKDENIQDTILIAVKKVMTMVQLERRNKELIRELEQKNKDLERLSFSDGLTGIPNRRYFDENIRQEWGRAIRECIPISIIMIDIDYFKKYNDIYGHQQGDICLKQVAASLQSPLKRYRDFISRYGGEEFSAVLPNTNHAGVVAVAAQMQHNVRNLAIPHEGSEVLPVVSVSIGTATVKPGGGMIFSELISRADHALYLAKKEGRNQIAHG